MPARRPAHRPLRPRVTAAMAVVVMAGAPAAVVVAAPAGTAATGTATARVFGGRALPAAPAWLAQVWVDGPHGVEICGGELVGRRVVLTAAHCVMSDGRVARPSTVRVSLGRALLSGEAPPLMVAAVEIAPHHDRTSAAGDLALLALTTPAGPNPLALAAPDSAVPGRTASVLGWGTTPVVRLSPVARDLEETIVEPDGCRTLWPDFRPESMICAGGVPLRGSCFGDSGGPLVVDPRRPAAVLLGTVDYGTPYCGDGRPEVFQRIDDGPNARWLRAALHVPGITVDPPSAAAGDTVTLTASGSGPGAHLTWDLDGDGAFDDGSGPQASLRLERPSTAAVHALSADGLDAVVTRVDVVAAATVTASAPREVREGDPVQLLVRAHGGSGTVSAAIAGAEGAAIDVPQASRLFVPTPQDTRWLPPRRAVIELRTTAGLSAAATAVPVRILDDDVPRLATSRLELRAGALRVRVVAPGRGRVTATATVAGARPRRARGRARGAGPLTLRLPIPRSWRTRRPSVGVHWVSSQQAGARADGAAVLARPAPGGQ